MGRIVSVITKRQHQEGDGKNPEAANKTTAMSVVLCFFIAWGRKNGARRGEKATGKLDEMKN